MSKVAKCPRQIVDNNSSMGASALWAPHLHSEAVLVFQLLQEIGLQLQISALILHVGLQGETSHNLLAVGGKQDTFKNISLYSYLSDEGMRHVASCLQICRHVAAEFIRTLGCCMRVIWETGSLNNKNLTPNMQDSVHIVVCMKTSVCYSLCDILCKEVFSRMLLYIICEKCGHDLI